MVGHAVVITLAVVATRTQLTARVPDERITPLPVFPPTPPTDASAPARPQGPRSPSQPMVGVPIAVPIIVPDGIVPLDTRYEIPMPQPTEWTGEDRGRLDGARGMTPPGGRGDHIPFASGVDKPAMALADNPPPRYPEVLRRNGVRGEVTVEVVIDTTGRAEMESLRFIASDHPLLSDAVRSALGRAQFLPAETAGRKVRMWVRQSFVFEVRQPSQS